MEASKAPRKKRVIITPAKLWQAAWHIKTAAQITLQRMSISFPIY